MKDPRASAGLGRRRGPARPLQRRANAGDASLYEGFGLPVLEAMALRRARNCRQSVVAAGGRGFSRLAGRPYDTLAIGEAMLRLETDAACQERLIEAGFTQARRFTWERAAIQLKSIYATLLDG